MTPHNPDTPTWQYLVETRTLTQQLPGSPAEAGYLAVRGDLGWELVGPPLCVPLTPPHSSGWVYYWKRRRMDPA